MFCLAGAVSTKTVKQQWEPVTARRLGGSLQQLAHFTFGCTRLHEVWIQNNVFLLNILLVEMTVILKAEETNKRKI